jgi:hypothetical protein
MNPADSMAAGTTIHQQQQQQLPPPFALSPVPHSHHHPHQFDHPATSSQLSLDMQLDAITNSLLSSSSYSNLSTTSLPANNSSLSYLSNTLNQPAPPAPPSTSPTCKRPLKSALKVRKSAPELIETGLNTEYPYPYPPLPGRSFTQQPHVGVPLDRHHHPQPQPPQASSTSYDSYEYPNHFLLPDPNFTLPDSLRAQYTYQLRLLQEEYVSKAVSAEWIRRRSRERMTMMMLEGGDDVLEAEAQAEAERMRMRGLEPVLTRFNGMTLEEVMHQHHHHNDDVTPPSSGGGSGSGHRVSFHDQVGIIEGESEYTAIDAAEYADDAPYPPWDDEEWEGHAGGAGVDIEEIGGEEEGDEEEEEDDEEDEEEEEEEEEEEFNYAFGDGFGSLDPIQPPTPTENITRPNRTISVSSSQMEDDGGSVVGDGGHDDQPQRESTSTSTSTSGSSSSLDPIVSPTRAVFHGHGVEESPTASNDSRSDVHGGGIQESESGVQSQFVPMVEVIAATPIIRVEELGNEFEARTMIDEDEERELVEEEEEKVEEPRTSEDSIGQKNSSSSTEEGSSGSTDSNATVQRLAAASSWSASDALENVEEGVANELVLSTPPQLPTPPLSGSPTAITEMESNGPSRPPLPAALQRLSNRLSRGGGHPMVPLEDFPPAGTTSDVPSQHPAFGPPRSLGDVEPGIEISSSVQSSARATPTQEGHRSQSGRRRSTQQPIGRSQYGSQNDPMHMVRTIAGIQFYFFSDFISVASRCRALSETAK